MKNITGNGFIFSLDLSFAALAILLMLFMLMSYYGTRIGNEANAVKGFSMQKTALFIADSLVKNRSENSLLGSAVFDTEGKRVKSGDLDLAALRLARPIESKDFVVSKLSVAINGVEEIIFAQEINGVNCISVERIVMAEGHKAVVAVKVCEK